MSFKIRAYEGRGQSEVVGHSQSSTTYPAQPVAEQAARALYTELALGPDYPALRICVLAQGDEGEGEEPVFIYTQEDYEAESFYQKLNEYLKNCTLTIHVELEKLDTSWQLWSHVQLLNPTGDKVLDARSETYRENLQ